MMSSVEDSMDSIRLTVSGASAMFIAVIFVSAAASESKKTKERMRL